MRWLICGSDKGKEIVSLIDELVLAIFGYNVFMCFCVYFVRTRSSECVFVCANVCSSSGVLLSACTIIVFVCVPANTHVQYFYVHGCPW